MVRRVQPLAVAVRRSSVTPGLYHIRPRLSRWNFHQFTIDHRLRRYTQSGRRIRFSIARGLYHRTDGKSSEILCNFLSFFCNHLSRGWMCPLFTLADTVPVVLVFRDSPAPETDIVTSSLSLEQFFKLASFPITNYDYCRTFYHNIFRNTYRYGKIFRLLP